MLEQKTLAPHHEQYRYDRDALMRLSAAARVCLIRLRARALAKNRDWMKLSVHDTALTADCPLDEVEAMVNELHASTLVIVTDSGSYLKFQLVPQPLRRRR
ncbi:hypothetical protein [Terriglobus aquaticus]|uniref:Uncharacterized protein n=1 Tax=Terriglobus aquaticus TaxID=940139 RepID=A0ABW9KIR0_9BACT|nr:hypothetical protein [Terriglobus aquaticus]